MKRPRTARVVATAWRDFYATGEGRAALAHLFKEFGLHASPEGDATALARAWGQRDVLVRIIQHINLKEDEAVPLDRDNTDVLERLMRDYV